MLKKRLISVLILRDGQVVQSVRFKHTNVIHYDQYTPWKLSTNGPWTRLSYSMSVEMKIAAISLLKSLNGYQDIVSPLSVGGWIDSYDYAQRLLRSGADKLVVNTILADDPTLVSRLSMRYGRQCIVASMDAKRDKSGMTGLLVDRGTGGLTLLQKHGRAKRWS